MNKNVVFEWHAKDHFAFDDADTFFLYQGPTIDWTHSNAVELDDDGKFYTKTFFSQGGITEFLEMLDSNAAHFKQISQIAELLGRELMTAAEYRAATGMPTKSRFKVEAVHA